MKKYLFLILFLILFDGCKSGNIISLELQYKEDIPLFLDYEMFVFKDKNDSIYIVMSDVIKKDSVLDTIYEKLKVDTTYYLELIPVEKGIFLENSLRIGPLLDFKLSDDFYITKNDTLVCQAYKTPNIIGYFYKRSK